MNSSTEIITHFLESATNESFVRIQSELKQQLGESVDAASIKPLLETLIVKPSMHNVAHASDPF